MRSPDTGTAILDLDLDLDPSPVHDGGDEGTDDLEVAERRRLAVPRVGKGLDPEAGYRSHRVIERVVAGTPWEERDLVRAGRTAVVGAIGLGVAWFAASDTNDWSRQMLWIAVAVAFVVYTAVGVGRWVLSGLGAVRMVRRQVVGEFQRIAASRSGSVDLDDDRWVVAPNMQRAHRPSCPFVAGKPVESLGTREIRDRRLRPCEVCAS